MVIMALKSSVQQLTKKGKKVNSTRTKKRNTSVYGSTLNKFKINIHNTKTGRTSKRSVLLNKTGKSINNRSLVSNSSLKTPVQNEKRNKTISRNNSKLSTLHNSPRVYRNYFSKRKLNSHSSGIVSSNNSTNSSFIISPVKPLKFWDFPEKANYYSNPNLKQKKYGKDYFKSFGYSVLAVPENAYNSAKAFPKGAINFIKSKNKRQQFNKVGSSLGKSYTSQDPRFIASVSTPFVPGAVIKTSSGAYKTSKFIGKKETNKFNYLDKKAVTKGKFPTSKSTKAQNKLLKKKFNEVVTVSPNKFKRNTKVIDSKKSKKGLEDAGIYVSPKGKGNPYFARINNKSSSRYTFNPKKIYDSFKGEFQIPTVTQFKTKGVVTPPKSVMSKKGFKATNNYNKKYVAGTGKVSNTKRSAVGRGEIKSKDLGTTEIEFVIPKGSRFKTKDTRQYVKINGQKVLVQKGMLEINKKFKAKQNSKFKSSSNSKYNSSSSSYKSPKKYKSPYKYSLSTPYKSSKYSPKSKPYSKSNVYSPSKSKPNYPFKNNPNYKFGGSSFKGGSSSSGGGSSKGSYNSNYGSYSPTVTTGGTNRRPPKFKKNKNKKSLNTFNMYIKKRGKWSQVNSQPLKFNTANKRMKSLLDNSLLRSGKITGNIPKGVKYKKFNVKNSGNSLLLSEKSKFTKDRKGEKTGLSRTRRYKK